MPTLPRIPLATGDRWMTCDEVATLFGVSHETINRWVRLEKLKSYKPSKVGYYKKSDVNALLAEKGLPTI